MLIASWNVGNKTPPALLHPLVPSGGDGADIIVVCAQEASYDASKGAIGTRCRRSVGSSSLNNASRF